MKFLYLLFSVLVSYAVVAQPADSVGLQQPNKQRLRIMVAGAAVGYSATMTGLYHLWYREAEQQSFRFFNDNAEWKQIDKAGHLFSSFYFAHGAARALRWSGLPKNKSDRFAALAAFAAMVPIEVMDGFSDAYGASTGDLIADAAGPVFFLGQQSLWNEIRIYPKMSFHQTSYASLRPAVLGDNLAGQILKDYNGHTFWLSIDGDKFTQFPKWLNIAIGYGAEGMIYARDYQNKSAGFSPNRQYYLSLDLDLTSIKTRSKVVKTLIFLGNMIKIPCPTVEFSRKGTTFHPFYF
jgi:hypothetical protein